MNCDTHQDEETYKFYQAAINALDLRLIDAPGCSIPPQDFVPRPCKDTALTAFAQLGALRLSVNRGMISLIDGRYQYILAEATRSLPMMPNVEPHVGDELWLGSVIIPRSKGICEHVLSLGDTLAGAINLEDDVPAIIINDLANDPRFSPRSYVKENPRVRFYAGVPLRNPWGRIIGAYCVFGDEPRDGLDRDSLLTLQGLATTIMTYLETSKAREGHRRYEQMIHGLTSFITGGSSLYSLEDRERKSTDRPPSIRRASGCNSVATEASAFAGAKPEDTDSPKIKAPTTPPPSLEAAPTPQNNKRPRNVSTPTPTARKKSTVSLQESMLPSGSQSMFSRAANIIRESTDICGCIIFDASVASFGGAINDRRRRSSGGFDINNPKINTHSSGETSSSPMSESDSSSSSREPWDSEQQHPGSDGERQRRRQMCDVLGFAYKNNSSVAGGDPETSCPPFAEADMKRLLGKYPSGHIFNMASNGNSSPSQASDDPLEGTPGVGRVNCDEIRPQDLRAARTNKTNMMVQKLLKVAPGARSLALLSLWDYQRERWFAGCLCWTTEPNRVLYPDVDLIYLQAFGNSIMMEVSRLDAVTADRAKTTFVASISHELRCPLHGILGGIQFLQDTSVDAYQAGMLDSVEMCGKTLLDTIDHVLDFSKVNTFSKTLSKGRVRFRDTNNITISGRKASRSHSEPNSLLEMVDLAVLTEEVVEAIFVGQTHGGALTKFARMAENMAVKRPARDSDAAMNPWPASFATGLGDDGRKPVRIVLDIPHRPNWVVTTQPGAWRRVVMNLFGNALKYTNSGTIRVSMRAKRSEAEHGPPSEEVTLVVADTGKGISSDYLRTGLWTPFSQEDSFAPGTGLGLSIVRQIVEGLGGRIDLKSEVKVGTEVKVNLPMLTNEEGSSLDEGDKLLTAVTAQLEGRTVCIVEKASPDDVDDSSTLVQKSQHDLSQSLRRTFTEWFRAHVYVVNPWTALSGDVILCLDPRVDFLATVRVRSPKEGMPLIVFIVLDANQAADLRNDPRIHDDALVVEIITQPCGPRKLAKVLNQALDRRERQLPLTVTPLASPMVPNFQDDAAPPVREWSIPSWTSARPAQAQASARGPANPILDPETVPQSPLAGSSTSTMMLEPPTENHLKILLVDDNRINLSLLTAFMKKYHFEYEEAMNGLQALEAYKRASGQFDYVLMDLTMPVMDGTTSTREIRRYEQREGIQPTTVIALTGLASATARVEALNSGINYFLTKPVKFQALHQMLKGTTN